MPTGPKIYRQDRPDIFEKYCRLMLIFFKPWRSCNDLRGNFESWNLAFVAYKSQLSTEFSRIVENMQCLQECKDSRDDHFKKQSTAVPDNLPSQFGSRDVPVDNVVYDNYDEATLLENLEHINAIDSRRSCAENCEASIVMDILHRTSFFNISVTTDETLCRFDGEGGYYCDNSHEIIVTEEDVLLERSWRLMYEKRRDEWKKSQMMDHIQNQAAQLDGIVLNKVVVGPSTCYQLRSARKVRPSDKQVDEYSDSGNIKQLSYLDKYRLSNGICQEVISLFDLNCKQSQAFSLITAHALGLDDRGPL